MTCPADRHLPVFVYGTLRVGGRFHESYLAGRFDSVRPATLAHAQMWDNHGSYPLVVLDPDAGPVTGEVFEIDAAIFPEVLAGLDHLEEYVPDADGNLYERVVVDVETAEGVVAAWVYVLDPAEVTRLDASLPRVSGGDWLDRPTP